MTDKKCPVCGCKHFYVKHPDDEYDIYEFECKGEGVVFNSDVDASDTPEVNENTETFCNDCAWHDRFDKLK